MPSATIIGSLAVGLTILFALLVAPYTKVEESFNLQAVHDLLAYGLARPFDAHIRAHYDHVEFPGAVPRTFVGAVALALASSPFARLLHFLSPSSFTGGQALQTTVRAVLGLWNAGCIAAYANGVQRAFGERVAVAFLAFQACQFHVVFYASRTLPNFFALGPVLLALRDLLPIPPSATTTTKAGGSTAGGENMVRRRQRALVLLTVVGIVFRSEIAALLACHTLNELARGRLGVVQVVQAGAVGLVAGLALTVPLDSFFWGRSLVTAPLWPELAAFVFNVVEGMAESWGVMPWHYYLSSSLPKLLFNPMLPLVCIPAAVLKDASGRVSNILLPNLAFVAIMSLQGHKEWRFIIYVVPALTTVAAIGLDYLGKAVGKDSESQKDKSRSEQKQKKSAGGGLVSSILYYGTLISLLAALAANYASIIIASLNYPGAAALNRFHLLSRFDDKGGVVSVHLDVPSCMTGITRFLQVPIAEISSSRASPDATELKWQYSKEENETVLQTPEFWQKLDYAITTAPKDPIGVWKTVAGLGTVTTLSGFSMTKSEAELQRQYQNADLSGDDPPGGFSLSNLSRMLIMQWNSVGLLLSGVTKGRWLTIRMEPLFHIMKHDHDASSKLYVSGS